ncbi:major facilitator superfamily domain-containing protein [Trichophaea hybrida]|nr:major facilitator superfamily domain-containing protein [Trichophaea hybrida]
MANSQPPSQGFDFPYLPALLLFLFEFSELVLTSPRIRLIEASICRSHYLAHDPSVINPDGSIDESLCKLDAIQARLAHIRGWQVFFEAIPVLLLAIPWGALADRVGRKRVLAINYIGYLIHISWILVVCHPGSTMAVEWVWVSALAFVLGGGPRTANVLILALVNDTSPAKERSERFYYTYSAYLVTELIAMPAASFLMERSILLPFALALLTLGACFPVLAAVPGVVLKQEEHSHITRGDEDGDEAAAGLLDDVGEERATTIPKHTATTLTSTFRYLRDEFSKAIYDTNILLVLLGHFICPVRQELVFQILIPYTSKRFSLPISTSGLMLSVVATVNLLIYLFVLTSLTRFLRRSLPSSHVDTLTASYSSLLLAFGCFAIGLAATFPLLLVSTVVFAAGFGIRLGLLSLLTSLVDPAKIGRVYTLVTVVEGFGEMISAPVLQGLWAWGLEKGGIWRGVPWIAGAVAYAAGWWWIGKVRVKGEWREDE